MLGTMLSKRFSLGKMSVVSAKEYSDNPLLYKNKKKTGNCLVICSKVFD